VAAPPVVVVCHTQAIIRSHARLFAVLEAVGINLLIPDLAIIHVAYLVYSCFNFFAALRSVVEKPSWARPTYNFPRVVVACAFDVAAAAVIAVTQAARIFARVHASALGVSELGIPSVAVPTLEGSGRVVAFASAFAAAVIFRALVNIFAALRPVVDIASGAILTLEGSHRVGAFACAVAAAVIFRALVLVFAALRSVVDIASVAILTLEGSGRVGAFAFAVAAAVIFLALVHIFAALRSVVDIPSVAILTLEGSGRVGAFAFAVAAAVIFRALVHVFAALRSVVGIPSWAILTYCGSINFRACAFAVTAAIVLKTRTFRFFFITNLLPFVYCVRWLADMTAETVVVESRAFAIRVTRARQKTLFESENVARSLGNKL